MKREQIAASLDLSKQLKEAGWDQFDSYFSWVEFEDGFTDLIATKDCIHITTDLEFTAIAAPTASELGEQLPLHFSISKCKSIKDPHWCSSCWWGDSPDPLRTVDKKTEWYQKSNKSMVDGMAEAWLYLKHQGLLSSKEEV